MIIKRHNNGVVYYQFSMFNTFDFIEHGFSTRLGGVSRGVFESMNLRMDSDDAQNKISKNYELFLEIFNGTLDHVYMSQQVHNDKIIMIDHDNKNKKYYKDVDGFVTRLEDIGLMTFHADCVPIFFVDPKNEVIGLVHSGWRGTNLKIASKMVDILLTQYDSDLENIMVGIGPAIGQCCYEVGKEVYDQFIEKQEEYKKFFNDYKDRYLMDLKGLNKEILMNSGILEENIEISELCTKCNQDVFFSHRAHGNDRGVMAAYISKKEA